MNGGQDLGGMHGFGPVVEDANEPQYHAHWESRAMSMVVALGACGQWNIDQSRHARETLPPADYLRFPYYRIWIEAASKLMLERGMIHKAELSGQMQHPPLPVKACLKPNDVWHSLHALGGAADRPAVSDPLFAVGNTIRTINTHPTGHTRLPRYARAKTGTITKVLGHHVFPDSAGNGQGDDPKWLYQVRFTATELWGQEANPRDSVTLDLWEPYFERP